MAREIVNYVMDTCGLLVYLRQEEGCEKVKTLFRDKYNRFFMHAVNVGEAYYDTLRKDKNEAQEIWDDIQQLPITIIWELDIPFIEIVGKYKTSFRVSYADCFVLALAEQRFATVISTDHHELESIEREGKIPFCWLR
ncbi:MAG: PIN domain-containing protein [bacterium]